MSERRAKLLIPCRTLSQQLSQLTQAIRVSELCDLTWSDAIRRGEGGQITVFGKGGKTRAVLRLSVIW